MIGGGCLWRRIINEVKGVNRVIAPCGRAVARINAEIALLPPISLNSHPIVPGGFDVT